MTISMTAMYELCSHGLRYCKPCGTVIESEYYSPEQWAEANRRIMAGKESKGKQEKVAND